jgi:hypothetical protein
MINKSELNLRLWQKNSALFLLFSWRFYAEFPRFWGCLIATALLPMVIGYIWQNNVTPAVWCYFLWSIPAMAVGMFAGISLDRYLKPKTFRRIVLVLLVITGWGLMFS